MFSFEYSLDISVLHNIYNLLITRILCLNMDGGSRDPIAARHSIIIILNVLLELRRYLPVLLKHLSRKIYSRAVYRSLEGR